jgi:hypothetical protein
MDTEYLPVLLPESKSLEALREQVRLVYSANYGKLTADEALTLQSAMYHLTSAAAMLGGCGVNNSRKGGE